MPMSHPAHPETLVLIKHLDNDDFYTMLEDVDLAPNNDIAYLEAYQAIVEYLLQWDHGNETEDDSIAFHGLFDYAQLTQVHTLIDIDAGGYTHWLHLDLAMSSASLYRAPRFNANP